MQHSDDRMTREELVAVTACHSGRARPVWSAATGRVEAYELRRSGTPPLFVGADHRGAVSRLLVEVWCSGVKLVDASEAHMLDMEQKRHRA